MLKLRVSHIVCGSILLAAALIVVPAFAQELVLSEDFSDPELPGWDRTPNVGVEAGMLYVPPEGLANHGGRWGDLTLTVVLRRSGAGPAVISYRDSSAGSYRLQILPETVVLSRVSGEGRARDLAASEPLRLSPDRIEVRATVVGGVHHVFVNVREVLVADDPDPLPAGGLVLGTQGEATAFFDDLRLALEEGPTDQQKAQGAEDGDGSRLFPDWAWAGLAVVFSGASFLVGRSSAAGAKMSWIDEAKVRWRVEAESELPEPLHACQWACKGKADATLFDRWKVTRIVLTPLPLSNGETDAPKVIEDAKLLAPLNDMANVARMLDREAMIEDRLSLLTQALVSRTMAWSQEGRSPAAFRVDADMAAPVNGKYELYHCTAGLTGLSWGKPLLTWKSQFNQLDGEQLALILGPKAGEVDYPGRLRAEFGECLLELVRAVRWRA